MEIEPLDGCPGCKLLVAARDDLELVFIEMREQVVNLATETCPYERNAIAASVAARIDGHLARMRDETKPGTAGAVTAGAAIEAA